MHHQTQTWAIAIAAAALAANLPDPRQPASVRSSPGTAR